MFLLSPVSMASHLGGDQNSGIAGIRGLNELFLEMERGTERKMRQLMV